MRTKKKKGIIIIEQIEFEDMHRRTVLKNNDKSGKVTVPTQWIGKEVYVVVPSKSKI